MRKSEKLYGQLCSIRCKAQKEIARLIKSTGENELIFDDPIQVVFFNESLNSDGWENEDIRSIVFNEQGAIIRIWSDYGYELDINNIHIGEWWYILDVVELHTENIN